MAADIPLRRSHDGPFARDGARMLVDLAGRSEGQDRGGEPACWAHLVCTDCGAMESESHSAALRIGSCLIR